MEYKRLGEDWREAEKSGDVDRALELLEQQMTDNLLEVRNAFAKCPACDPDEAFGFLFDYCDIRPEYREIIDEFPDLGDALEDIRMDQELADEHCSMEGLLRQCAELEEKIISAIEKYDDDYILRELCRTVKERVEQLSLTFIWLLYGASKAPERLNEIYIRYVQNIGLEGDPVVVIEYIQAKLQAIREKAAIEDTDGFEKAEAIQCDLMSIVATIEGLFEAEGCDMTMLEDALQKRMLYKSEHRQADVSTVKPECEMPDGDTLTLLKSLVNRAWKRTGDLGNVIDIIVSTTMEQGTKELKTNE